MKYKEFEQIISSERISRYVQACGGDTRKAMTLYRYNVELSLSVFAIIGYFEVALRNAIDRQLTANLGREWLKDSVMANGIFTNPILAKTQSIILFAYNKLQRNVAYSHTKLLAEPICFPVQSNVIYTDYILNEYQKMMVLLQWMGIDNHKYLFGLDHVQRVCAKIDRLKPI